MRHTGEMQQTPGGAGKSPDTIQRLVGWAVDHVEADANFEGEPSLLIDDPELAAAAALLAESDLEDRPWKWIDLDTGRLILLRGISRDADGPWVWVLGSDDGPLSSIAISPALESGECQVRGDRNPGLPVR